MIETRQQRDKREASEKDMRDRRARRYADKLRRDAEHEKARKEQPKTPELL